MPPPQVGAQLWRRNGGDMLSQTLNYATPPHCVKFRDLDLTLVQVPITLVLHDHTIFLIDYSTT